MLFCCCWFFFFKETTAYEMRIIDWSSDVCSSDLDICALPMRGFVGVLHDVPDVVAGGEHQRVEVRELLAREVIGDVIADQDRQRRERALFLRGMARGNRDLMTEALQMQRGVSANQARAADDENLDRKSTRLNSSH